MILKSTDLKKINFKQNKIILLYGKNEGLKEQAVKEIIKNKDNIFTYEEKEILDNQNNFFEIALTRSLFEQDRNIIIKRASDKMLSIIKEICLKDLDDIKILNQDGLRFSDEFVRHKVLDFIGDISLSGYRMLGSFYTSHSGHSLNNMLLNKIFESKENWELVCSN